MTAAQPIRLAREPGPMDSQPLQLVTVARGRAQRLLPRDLADALREARERAGLKLCELAALVGISPSYLGALERGRRCPSVTVARELVPILEPEMAARLMQVAVQDAGRSHPNRPQTISTPRLVQLAREIANRHARLDREAGGPYGQRSTSGRAAGLLGAGGTADGGEDRGGCDLSLDRQGVDG